MAFGELQSFGTSSGLRLGAVVEYYDLNVENSGCAPFWRGAEFLELC